MFGNIQVTSVSDKTLKRRPGRPKGLAKTGGRKPGSKNIVPSDLRRFINQRGRPLELLAAIASGRKVSAGDPGNPSAKIRVYPTLNERVSAAKVLTNKLVPDLRATEISGSDGGPVKIEDKPYTKMELARRLLFILREATEEANDNAPNCAAPVPADR